MLLSLDNPNRRKTKHDQRTRPWSSAFVEVRSLAFRADRLLVALTNPAERRSRASEAHEHDG